MTDCDQGEPRTLGQPSDAPIGPASGGMTRNRHAEVTLSAAEIIAKFSTYGYSHEDAEALQKAAVAKGRTLAIKNEGDGTFSLFDVDACLTWKDGATEVGPEKGERR
jgi:hypothetical protein